LEESLGKVHGGLYIPSHFHVSFHVSIFTPMFCVYVILDFKQVEINRTFRFSYFVAFWLHYRICDVHS